MPVQGRFVENDHMVQTFAANGADHPFDVRTLPRRSWRSQRFLNAKLLHLLGEIRTEDAVAIPAVKNAVRCPTEMPPAVAAQSIPQSDEPSRRNVESRLVRKPSVYNAPHINCQIAISEIACRVFRLIDQMGQR